MLIKDKLMMQIFQSTTTFPVKSDVEELSVDKAKTFFFFFFRTYKEVSKFIACQIGFQ